PRDTFGRRECGLFPAHATDQDARIDQDRFHAFFRSCSKVISRSSQTPSNPANGSFSRLASRSTNSTNRALMLFLRRRLSMAALRLNFSGTERVSLVVIGLRIDARRYMIPGRDGDRPHTLPPLTSSTTPGSSRVVVSPRFC